jgi:hypothetical protein
MLIALLRPATLALALFCAPVVVLAAYIFWLVVPAVVSEVVPTVVSEVVPAVVQSLTKSSN